MASFQFDREARNLRALLSNRLNTPQRRHAVPPTLTEEVPVDSLLPSGYDSRYESGFDARLDSRFAPDHPGLDIIEHDDSGFSVTQPGELCTLSFGGRGSVD